MTRESGYYWVKLKRVNSDWEPAFYNALGWQLTGLNTIYHSRDFKEIDENRITRTIELSGNVELKGEDLKAKLFGLL